MTSMRPVLLLACASAAFLLCGCGGSGYDNIAPVSGVVTLDGKPAGNVMVTFTPEGGGVASSGITDSQGKYELIYIDAKGAQIGRHRVAVTTISGMKAPEALPSEIRSDDPRYAEMMTQDYAAQSAAQSKADPIPAKYNTATELMKDVVKGSNEINLELTTDGAK